MSYLTELPYYTVLRFETICLSVRYSLLFAVCIDILLRMLDKRIEDGVFKAFADDIAAIVRDFWKEEKYWKKRSLNLRRCQIWI